MAKSKKETVEEALALGLAFDEATSQKDIQAMIDIKLSDLDADGNPKLTPEEEARRSDYVGKKLAEKQEADRLAREQQRQQNGGDANTSGEAKLYTEDEMRALFKKLVAEMGLKTNQDDDLDEELYKQKKVRLPRYNGKFVLGFNNMNTDEFFPDLVVQAFDIWDDQQKRMVAWVEAKFLDGTALKAPLYSIITRSIKVDCDLVEVLKNPLKIDNGRTEIIGPEKDYSRKGTGSFTRMKVTQDEYQFKIRIPGTGEEVVVGPEVINW